VNVQAPYLCVAGRPGTAWRSFGDKPIIVDGGFPASRCVPRLDQAQIKPLNHKWRGRR